MHGLPNILSLERLCLKTKGDGERHCSQQVLRQTLPQPVGVYVLYILRSTDIVIHITALTAYQIWRSEQRFRRAQANLNLNVRRQSFRLIVKIIVESGAINAASLIAYTAVLNSASGTDGLPIMSDIVSTPI